MTPRTSEIRLAILAASFNRPHLTERLVQSVQAEQLEVPVSWFIVDASTNDETHARLMALGVEVHRVPSDWFWSQSMALAEELALRSDCTHVLWVNDDVLLNQSAVTELLGHWRRAATEFRSEEMIILGSMADKDGMVSYGGVQFARRVTKWSHVSPRTHGFTRVDAGNGNLLLASREVCSIVGPIDPKFGHGYGDFDWTRRAVEAGVAVMLAPGYFGLCPRNPVEGTYLDSKLTRKARWRHLVSAKGLPLAAHARYLRRHGGPLWPILWAAPYVKALVWKNSR